MKRIAQIEKQFMREDIPPFTPGDTLRVHVRIKEGDKERIQVFQGTVIGRRGGGTGETFTVRKISGGVGVERVFPLHSPNIAKIEKIRSGAVRRAKLYYLRQLTGKSARIKEELSDVNKAAAAPKAAAPAPAPAETPKPEAAAPAPEAEAKAKAEPEAAPAEETPAEKTAATEEEKPKE